VRLRALSLAKAAASSFKMSTELVTLQHFRDVPEALLAKGKLESAGIACALADGNLVRMDWLLSNAIGGIRSLPANGSLYAFHRTSGALHWASEVKTQQLLLEQIEDSPVLLFSALLQRTPAGPAAPAPGPVFTVTSIDKQTGKVLWLPKDYASITSPVHRVEINPATGTIDMISKHWKMRHVLVE